MLYIVVYYDIIEENRGGIMKLYYDKKSKDPIYYIQIGIRNGNKTTTKNVSRIGKHSELLFLTPDPLAYANQMVKKANDEIKNKKIEMNIKIDFNEKVTPTSDIVSESNQLNIGYFILQKIYHDLNLSDFFHKISANKKITFNCNDIHRFLVFDRILDPASKLETLNHLHNFYEKPEFDYQHIMRYMDVLVEHYDEYLEHLFTNSNVITPRDTSICYYDCTNYYFETEQEDPDYIDEITGEIIKGFRKNAISKQHQPTPLVQMGLFMDGSGIPISMCINSGSDNEQLSAIPLEEKIIKMFKNKKFIYCADAGLGSLDIRKFNSVKDRAFIVTQSIKKLSDSLQDAVFNDYEYKLLSNDQPISTEFLKSFDRHNGDNLDLYKDRAYKIIEVESLIDIGLSEEKTFLNGKKKKVKAKAKLRQRIIITYSRKMMEYQRNIRNGQIERARKLVRNGSIDAVKKGPHDVKRFIKRTAKTADGANATIEEYFVDEAVISKEERYDGYYAIATNLNDPAKSIIDINSKRYKIEDCFRILKTNFNSRPVFHSDKEHIIAHFMICYAALLIYRLLEIKLDNYGEHFTTRDIVKTLQNMNVTNNQDMFYQALFNGSQICSAFNGLYNLGLDKKYYLPKDLNKIIKNISK